MRLSFKLEAMAKQHWCSPCKIWKTIIHSNWLKLFENIPHPHKAVKQASLIWAPTRCYLVLPKQALALLQVFSSACSHPPSLIAHLHPNKALCLPVTLPWVPSTHSALFGPSASPQLCCGILRLLSLPAAGFTQIHQINKINPPSPFSAMLLCQSVL